MKYETIESKLPEEQKFPFDRFYSLRRYVQIQTGLFTAIIYKDSMPFLHIHDN